MAESPSSSISGKPPIEKVGLGFLIDDAILSDPINPDSYNAEIHPNSTLEDAPGGESALPTPVMAGEDAAPDEEMEELRNSIERDLCELTMQQAKIEAASERLQSVGVEEENGNYLGTGETSEKDSASLEDEHENDGGDEDKEGSVASKLGDGETNFGRFNLNNRRRMINYPMRPDAEDCSYYIKFGSCKFGMNCKFNHPPRRKSQAYWQPHNRAVARRIQNMGWRADGGLWLLARGGGLYLSKGTGISEEFEEIPVQSRGFGILDVGYRSEDEAWAAGGSGVLLKTTNSGKS